MTGVTMATLQAWRLRYNAALAAHQGRARALHEALASGKGASAEMIRAEAEARAQLDRARAALLAALTESITGKPAVDSPAPRGSATDTPDAPEP
jgi:hypothetical protein